MTSFFNECREMISLCGLTEHTMKSYSIYIQTYLDYVTNVLHKSQEDVSRTEMRDFIRWIQSERDLADRTINCCIAQLHFFTVMTMPFRCAARHHREMKRGCFETQ